MDPSIYYLLITRYDSTQYTFQAHDSIEDIHNIDTSAISQRECLQVKGMIFIVNESVVG